MNKRIFYILIVLTILFFIITTYKISNLTFANKDYYQEQLAIKTNKIISGSSAPRGRILDRNGNILVDNIGVKTITYTKINSLTKNDEIEIAKSLAAILDINNKSNDKILKDFWLATNKSDYLITDEENELFKKRKMNNNDIYDLKIERISEEMLKNIDSKIAYIYYLMNRGYSYESKIIKAENVSEAEFAKVLESKIMGVTGEITWERTFPYGNTLRSIFGNISSKETGIPKEKKEHYLSLGYSLNDRVGISYLEEYYEEYLRGTKDIYQINKDNTLSLYKEGQRGNDLVLSIDINLQLETEKILEKEINSGKNLRNTEYFNHSYVIISDPKTGSIIAIAGKEILSSSTNTTFKDVTTNIINSSYTMGSVVKGASMAVGYKNNLISYGTKLNDACVKLYNVPEKCSWKRLGYIDEVSALRYSSNYYQYLLAIGVTGNKYNYGMNISATEDHFNNYRNTFASFGLGVKTGIDLPNEKIGLIGEDVAIDLLLNYAIGQYDTYTPIELVQYINTIANDGQRIAPGLMLKILDSNGNVIKEKDNKVLNSLEINSKDLKKIQEGFKEVISIGTALGYVNQSYKAAGKTGTSESLYWNGSKNIETTSATFAMYAPYDNPKYSLVVISPHVSHNNGKTDYFAWINKYISKKVSDFLFENY